MEALQHIPPSEQAEFMRHLEEMQAKESLRMCNDLVYRCFNQCSRGFKSKHLDDKEGTCVSNCAEKFIKVTQRVGFRFSEHQAANAAAQQAQAGR